MRIFRFSCVIIAISVILTFSAFAAPPVIVTQPTDYLYPANTVLPQYAYYSVAAEGTNLSYQWQISWNGGNWSNLADYGTNSTLGVRITDQGVNGVAKFRCIVSNSEGSVVTNTVTTTVAAYIFDSIPQMLLWVTDIGDSIFSWIASACACIIGTPLLLIGVSFFALGAAIAILSRLLSRS